MRIVRWIIFSLIIIYFLMAFVFVNLSLNIRAKLVHSRDKIKSLLEQHRSLLTLLTKEMKNSKLKEEDNFSLDESLTLSEKHKLIATHETNLRSYIKTANIESEDITKLFIALDENGALIRNEIYRHNRAIDNLHAIVNSIIFVVFVQIINFPPQEKI